MCIGRQVLCQNNQGVIRNYFNIFSAGGGIIIFQMPVEFNQHPTKKQWNKGIYDAYNN